MTAYMDHKDLGNVEISQERRDEIMRNVHEVFERIRTACENSGRDPQTVQLLAATKTRDVGEILAAVDAGVRLIGENRPQEVLAKAEILREQCKSRNIELGGAELPFHLIGQLQSNKISKVLPFINAIESVDSFELAQKIARRACARNINTDVLLEVNVSGEESKSGCVPAQALDIAQKIAGLEGVQLSGLMSVGAHVLDKTVIAQGFQKLRELRDEILNSGVQGVQFCKELSMGMSFDLDIAIAQGSTIVRVGTAIFGERDFK
ncbi:MAG: YggS family pyridoxal phosphate-dependent enzyme [Bifidobacteriaceae bacterium]|nr:YggS family pyridoxal phosphate-dependent enzyme [Bifidobacteriaceae bacterium]